MTEVNVLDETPGQGEDEGTEVDGQGRKSYVDLIRDMYRILNRVEEFSSAGCECQSPK